MQITVILILSILFQIMAIIGALRLMRITGRWRIWILISVAFLLMAIRRSIALSAILGGAPVSPPVMSEELVALATSILMVAGIVWIAPLFFSIRRAEDALQEGEEKYRSLTDDVLDTSPVGILILDPDFRVVWMNRALEHYFGLHRDEVIGKDSSHLIRKKTMHIFENAEEFAEKVLSTYKNNSDFETFECHILPDGKRQERWLEHRSQPIRTGLYAGGRIEQYYDITERKRAAGALARSEAIYREAIENATGVPYRLYFADRKYDFVGSGLEALVGIPAEQLTFERLKEIVNEVRVTDPNAPFDIFEYSKAYRSGKIRRYCVDMQIVTPAGKEKWVSDCAVPIRDEKTGDVIGSLGVLQDITERKRAEEELRNNEEKYRYLYEESQTINIIVGMDGKIIDVNKSLINLSRYEEDELIGKDISEFVVPEQREKAKELLAQRFNGENTHSTEFDMIGKEGVRTFLFSGGHATLSEKGKPVGILLSAIDITKRKQEEQINRRLAEIIRNASDGVILTDPVGRILYANSAFKRMSGYTLDEILNRDPADFIVTDDIAAISNEIRSTVRTKGEWAGELLCRRKSGEVYPVESRVFAVRDATGEIVVIAAVQQDISKRKRAEEEREALRRLSQRLTGPLTIKEVGQTVAVESRRLFGHDAFLLDLYDESTHILSGVYYEDTPIGETEPNDVPIMAEFQHTAWMNDVVGGKTKLFNRDKEPEERPTQLFGYDSSTSRSLMFVPIRWEGHTVGVLSVQSYTPYRYCKRELALLQTFADQCGGALARARAEEALRGSEETAQALLNAPPETSMLVNPDGIILKVNATAAERLGRSVDELIGTCVFDLLPPDVAEFRKKYGNEVIRSGKPVRFEDVCEGRIYDTSVFPVLDARGKVSRLAIFARDIAESKQAEEALRTSEEKFRALTETTTDWIWEVDKEGVYTYVSPKIKELLGYEVNEVLGKTPFDLMAGEEAEKVSEVFKEKVANKEPFYKLENVNRHKDGHLVVLETNGIPIFDEKGQLKGYRGIDRDITEHKRAEEELLKSRDKLQRIQMQHQAVLRGTPNGLCMLTPDLTIIWLNPSMSRILYPGTGATQDLTGLLFKSLFANEKDFNDYRDSALKLVRKTGSDQRELLMKRIDGTQFWGAVSIVRLNPTETSAGYVVTLSDITEQKQAEEEKAKILAQLFQAQKMEAVGALAGGIAHDLSNFETVIQGFAELALKDIEESDPSYGFLKRIRHSAGRATRLIRQLLLFSRKQPMKISSLNINRTATDFLTILTYLIGEDITIDTEREPDLWTVRADKGKIEQVLMNLILNARDAMPEGGEITIKTENVTLDEDACSAMPQMRPGKFVCLSVSDTGRGMTKETIQRIFEPFFTTKKGEKGTGLGLSVVYGLVEQHEGWIDVDSEPGHGATFKIYLPVSSVKPENEDKEAISLQEIRGNGERILLVEDDTELREFATRALRESGYVVFEAQDAQEALGIFEREKGEVHLVFSDVVLPDKTGLQLIDKLLALKPELRVLMTSGYKDEKSRLPIIRQRGFRFLQKPYALTDLLQGIRDILDR